MAPPSGTVPPTLPPSVEESYRRKCIQLKRRMNEVEEANDASRLRLSRMHRAIEKMRLERAFLLEQLARRTAANVEDSEGSPSPPPTPKEKPLRTKRGHRKPSFLANLNDAKPGSTFIQQDPAASPLSNTFATSHSQDTPAPSGKGSSSRTNGAPASKPPKKPGNAFDLYCQDMRSVLMVKHRQEIADGTYDVDKQLAQGWRQLSKDEQEEFYKRFEREKSRYEAAKEQYQREKEESKASKSADITDADVALKDEPDEDVAMADDVDEADGDVEGEAGASAN